VAEPEPPLRLVSGFPPRYHRAVKATSASPEENLGVELGGVLVGKYRIEAILGQGGMGVVAKATHLHLNETVAIKFLRADIAGDDEANQRFLREAHAVWKLKNEHVARVIDVGSLDSGLPYLVMEYLEGVDLDGMLEQSTRVAPALAVEFIVQACEGLAEAHSFGIIHRDVKPSNFFVTWRNDGTPLVKLLDFGISKVANSTDVSLTQTQSMLGTPAYMSPEQMRSARTVDQRTDVWSLGAVMFELIEGTRPFEAESFSEMCVKVAVDPPSPFTVPLPPGLDAVVRRCLEKSPEARYANVAEVAAALVPFSPSPQAAQLAVERMHRMLLRSSAPMIVTDAKSAPVEIPREDVLAAYPPRRTTPWAGGGAPMPATAALTPWGSAHASSGSSPALTPLPGPMPAMASTAAPTLPGARRVDDELSRTAFTPRSPRTSAPMTTPRRVGPHRRDRRGADRRDHRRDRGARERRWGAEGRAVGERRGRDRERGREWIGDGE
jgi:serine/threonine protein kinase